MGRPGQWWIQQSRNRQVAYTLLFVLAFTLIGSAIAFMGRSQLPYRTGQTVTDPILSRVRFESIDTKSTQENRKSAFEREPAVYRTNVPYFMTLRQKLVELVVELASTDIEHLALDVRQKLKIDAAALTALQQYIEGDRPSTQWQQIVDSFVADIMTVAVLDRERAEAERGGVPDVGRDPEEGQRAEPEAGGHHELETGADQQSRGAARPRALVGLLRAAAI